MIAPHVQFVIDATQWETFDKSRVEELVDAFEKFGLADVRAVIESVQGSTERKMMMQQINQNCATVSRFNETVRRWAQERQVEREKQQADGAAADAAAAEKAAEEKAADEAEAETLHRRGE